MRLKGVSGGKHNLRRRRIVSHPSSQSDAAWEDLAEITVAVVLEWGSEQSLGERKSRLLLRIREVSLISSDKARHPSNHRLRRHFEVLRPSSRQTVEETRKIRRF